MENKENIQPALTTNDKLNIVMLTYIANEKIRNYLDEQYGFFKKDMMAYADDNEESWEAAYEECVETFEKHIDILYDAVVNYY